MSAILAPLLTRILPYIFAALAAAVIAAVLTHKVDDGELNNLKAQYATAQAQAATAALAKQQAFDADAQLAAQQDQVKQLALTTATQGFQQQVIRYVPKTTSCVPVGLVSVLRGAIGLSVNGSVSNATAKSDDACSFVGWPQLAAGVIDAFGRARANGDQLNALEDFINTTRAVK